jgi:sigma-E factor negative regulatory protein RseB
MHVLRLPPLSRFGLVLSAALLSFAPAALAGRDGAETRDIRGWLQRIHEAASQRSFVGTFVVGSAGSVSSARIAHYCEGKDQFERIESLDGEKRHVLRHNDKVQVQWPTQRVAVVQKREVPKTFPALLQGAGDTLADFYEVVPQGSDRVAGHEADVLLVKPKDALRYGYRLWAERQTGLLLRSEVLGERGDVLETSAFSEVTLGVKPQIESVLGAMRRLDGYRVLKPTLGATTLEAEGWSLRQPAAGFQLISCVKRALDAGERDAASDEVIQTIYSDGLTHVSVFIEPYRSQRHPKPMATVLGATQTLMQRHGDWWITVVGDVPPATLKQFARNLERKN